MLLRWQKAIEPVTGDSAISAVRLVGTREAWTPHASRPTPATASGSAVPTPVTGSGPVPVTGEAEKDLNENRPVTAVTAVTADLAIESNTCFAAGVGAQAGVGARTLLNEFGGNTGNIGNRNEYPPDVCRFPGVVSVTAFNAKAGTEQRKVVTAELVAWHRGVAALQYLPPPPGFDPRRWKTLQLDAAGLLEGYGEELLHLGWSDVDAFGIHPTHPAIRPDCMGLGPLLNGGWVVEVTADNARIERRSGAKLTGVRRPFERAVPVWELRLEGEWLRAGRKSAVASPSLGDDARPGSGRQQPAARDSQRERWMTTDTATSRVLELAESGLSVRIPTATTVLLGW